MGLFDFISRIRRNHALEHATIHLLNRRQAHLSLVGRSDWGGFTIYGPVDTADLRQAAAEALQRLQAGETELAVHSRCGTVLATTGILTALASFLAISLDGSGKRFRWSSIPAAMLAATGAAILAQPVGLMLQEQFTTNSDPGQLEIRDIRFHSTGNLIVHRVDTGQ